MQYLSASVIYTLKITNHTRLIVIALSEGVDRVYLYQMVDIDKGNHTHDSFYGLLRHENTVCGLYSPKPQYVSYGVLIRQLDGMKYSSKEIADNVYRYEFTDGADNVSVFIPAVEQRIIYMKPRGLLK